MTEDKFEKFRNGMDYLINTQIIRRVMIGVVVIGVLYLSGFLMQIATTVIVAFKGLKTAIKKPA